MAQNIRAMVASAKIQVRKIIQWIVGWLKLIPGVNIFFLEQEAKIKADKILDMVEEESSQKEQ